METYDAAFRVMAGDDQRWAPATRETADHSLPYTIAMALQEGRLESASYASERLADPATRALMKKIAVKPAEAMTKAYPAKAQTRISRFATPTAVRILFWDTLCPLG